MRILALDLGTKTGWASWCGDSSTTLSGTWKLATASEIKKQGAANRDRCCDIRATRLREYVRSFRLGDQDAIYFEDVQFVSTVMQVQLWSSLRAILWLEANQALAPKVVAVPVGTLKKFATGHGNADKKHMALAAVQRGFSVISADDNQIDAWLLLQYALQNGTAL